MNHMFVLLTQVPKKLSGDKVFMIFFASLVIAFLIMEPYRRRQADKRTIAKLKREFRKPSERLFYRDKVEDFYQATFESRKQERQVDEVTWTDLDMDNIYSHLNICQSSLGDEYFYREFHYFENQQRRSLRAKLMELFRHKDDLRARIQLIFRKLGRDEYNGLARFVLEKHSRLYEKWFLYLFGFLPLATLVAGIFDSRFFALTLLTFVINGVLFYRAKQVVKGRLETLSYFYKIVFAAKKIGKIKDQEFSFYQEELAPYLKLISKLKGVPFLSAGFSETNLILTYMRIFLLSDLRSYNGALDLIEAHQQEVLDFMAMLGELEMGIAMANLLEIYPDICQVKIVEQSLGFKNLYHPLIEDPVKNSIENYENTLITGSNASGKSTFIKSVAISAIFGQIFGFAFADEFHLKEGRVLSSMALRDNIVHGKSYFMREIENLKRIVDKVEKEYCMVFIDEILRGTNTIERIAASSTILEEMSQYESRITVATHDLELTKLLHNRYDNYHFKETYVEGDILFDYKLKEGESTTKNAINLLESLGYSKDTVENARERAERFTNSGTWQ